ncbi:MAG: beta-galactosidase, partial [Solirubrobacteraceae bacterium]
AGLAGLLVAALLASAPAAVAASRDRTPPKVTWLSPGGAKTAATGAKNGCKVRARDRSGVARVDYVVRGRRVSRDRKAPFSCEGISRKLKPGRYKVDARAFDLRGNRGSARKVITVTGSEASDDPSSSADDPSSSAGARPPVTVPGPRADVPAQPASGIHASLRYMDEPGMKQVMAQMRDAGMAYAREDLSWKEIEVTPGQYDWSWYDVIVSNAARNGLRLILIPNNSPVWATGAWNRMPSSGAALDAYIRFIRKAIERYGSGGAFWSSRPDVPKLPIATWDIWNEPYVPSQTENPNPAAYAGMFKAVVSAVRGVDPAARFMLEADLGTVGPDPQPPFLEALFDAVPDLGRYADIVSLHAYTVNSPTQCDRGKPVSKGFQSWNPIRYELCRVQDIRRILDERGASNARMWITELGWSTGGSRPVSEATQAQYVREAYAKLREWRLVDVVTWFHLKTMERDPANPEDFFGFLHADGSPKPAWSALTGEIRA